MKKLISCIAILLSTSANANIVAVSPSVMSATHTATQGDPRDYPAEISYIIYTAKTPQDFERLSDYGFTELQILDMQIELLEKQNIPLLSWRS